MNLPITAFYTALFLLLMIALAANVVRQRMLQKVSLGDGGKPPLQQAIRAHANAAEYIPLVLIGMGALESLGGSASALYLYGSVFFLGRLSHAIGLGRPNPVNKLRQGGIVLSWLVMLVLAIHLLVRVFTIGPTGA